MHNVSDPSFVDRENFEKEGKNVESNMYFFMYAMHYMHILIFCSNCYRYLFFTYQQELKKHDD